MLGESGQLSVSYTGFKTVVVDVSSSSANNDVVMEDDYASLDEIVISGLATNIKRSNTGPILLPLLVPKNLLV